MLDFLRPSLKDHGKNAPDIVRFGEGRPAMTADNKESTLLWQYLDKDGNLLIAPLEALASKTSIGSKPSENIHITKQEELLIKTSDNLQKHLDALESLEVIEALSTIDSPWNEVVGQIVQSEPLTIVFPDYSDRIAYTDQLLLPIGADLFSEIRKMTSDPLQREAMFHCVAEELLKDSKFLRAFEKYLPIPGNTMPIDWSMKRMVLETAGVSLSGQEEEKEIDRQYRDCIHKTILKSRLTSEQPEFIINQYKHELENVRTELSSTSMPFAKEEISQQIREIESELLDMKHIRNVIDRLLPTVTDELTLLRALDTVQNTRFQDLISDDIPPHLLEPWVPSSFRETARKQLSDLLSPKEDLLAKTYKGLDAIEQKTNNTHLVDSDTWGNKRYKKHMEYLRDPEAQAKRKQIILNILDLTMTLTSLAAGVSGGIQRQIEGPQAINIQEVLNNINAQEPWTIAADLASPKNRRELV